MSDLEITLLASAIMHYEGAYSSRSVAYNNNNPGNIEGHDGKFLHYTTKLAGYQALVADILANKGKTLQSFLFKYAPPSENDTQTYLDTVCGITGITPLTVI